MNESFDEAYARALEAELLAGDGCTATAADGHPCGLEVERDGLCALHRNGWEVTLDEMRGYTVAVPLDGGRVLLWTVTADPSGNPETMKVLVMRGERVLASTGRLPGLPAVVGLFKAAEAFRAKLDPDAWELPKPTERPDEDEPDDEPEFDL